MSDTYLDDIGEITFREPESNHISFSTGDKEMLRIAEDGFYVEGVKLEDPLDVYVRFHTWLTAEENKDDKEEGKQVGSTTT